MKRELSSEKSTFIFRILRIAVLAAAGVLTVLRVLNLSLFYDAEIGYYSRGAVLPVIYTVFAVLCAAAVLAVSIIIRKNAPDVQEYTLSSRCAAVFAALSFALASVSAILSPHSWAVFYRGTTQSVGFYLITALYVAAPIAACAYFVLYAIKKASPVASFIGGIGGIIYSVIVLAISYFDVYVQMNAPEKLAVHLSAVCAMLLILSEMRVMIGAKKNAFYLFSVSLSSLFLISNSLPTAIMSFAGLFNGGVTTPPELHCYVFLALGIFAVVRLIMTDADKENV